MSSVPVVLPPVATAELTVEGSSMLEKALKLHVVDDASYQQASDLLNAAARVEARIVEAFKDPKQKAHAAHKSICDLETTVLGQPREAIRVVKEKGRIYLWEEDQRRRQEEARIAAELRAKEEAERVAAAVEAEAAGASEEEVAQVLDTPQPVPVVEVARPVARGVAQRKRYTFEVTNKAAIKHEYLIPNDPLIRSMVQRLGKDAATVVGGIKVVEVLEMVRSGR